MNKINIGCKAIAGRGGGVGGGEGGVSAWALDMQNPLRLRNYKVHNKVYTVHTIL